MTVILLYLTCLSTLLSISVSSQMEPSYVIDSAVACSGEPDPELLIWIHSAAQNTRKRNAIRLSWGHGSLYENIFRVKVIFFVGLPSDSTIISSSRRGAMTQAEIERRKESLQNLLYFEQQKYRDLVQGAFLDSYRNMTHKAVHSLKWISTYCSQAKFIMKTDDDILVNMYKLLPFLALKYKKAYYPEYVISCNLWAHARPVRDPEDKWYISQEDYPQATFPPFCQGMTYFLTPDLINRLYEMSKQVPYLFMDDVYITGIVANKLTNPPVTYKKLSAEYARVYGIGDKVTDFVRKNTKRVTFIHTDTVDSYLLSWSIVTEDYRDWSTESLLQKLNNYKTKAKA